MSLIQGLHRAVLTIAHAVRAEVASLGGPVFALDIAHDDGRRLVLKDRSRELTIDRRFGTVKSGSRVLLRFGDVRTIELRCLRQYRDDTPWCGR